MFKKFVLSALTTAAFSEARVEQIVAPQIVSVNHTESLPLTVGDVLHAYRQVQFSNMSVVTAKLKIIALDHDSVLAEITEDSTTESKALFKKFPYLMAGDLVRLPDLKITPTRQSLPSISLPFREIFLDPKNSPVSFDLSEKGLSHLLDEMAPFATSKVGKIIVEAFVDDSSTQTVSLLESQLRAKAVRQILIDELAIEPSRVIALGFGEMEASTDRMTPNEREQNRRIVIRFSAE